MHSALSMEAQWREMDKEIAQSPMPTEYQDATVKVGNGAGKLKENMSYINQKTKVY